MKSRDWKSQREEKSRREKSRREKIREEKESEERGRSGPSMRCFVHFDLEMCFAPQPRAIFHLSSGQMAPHPPL